MCLPVIAPPQLRGRDMYIGGSLVDNLPVKVMADLGEGPVIAVDVKATFERPVGQRDHVVPDREARSLPSFGETLARVLLLGSANTSESARRFADLTIQPRVEGVGLLEFHQLDAAREAGRAAVDAALVEGSAVWP
jgi:NTE family protein